jgi:5'-3' exoribonuclease 1
MGVLPDRSKAIVPEAYHPLMTDPKSPIIDFYPRQFELDMDGKKMEWEAVVKIPFIEEKRLLEAMATREHLLTPEENERNGFGVSLKFVYSPNLDFVYPSSLPGYFPDLDHCHCIENIFELPTMHELEVYVGLVEGSLLGVKALAGFPSLYTLPFNGQLGFHGVTVFQQESRNESMVVTLSNSEAQSKMTVAKERLGKSIFVGYPFLQEAKVVKVSDDLFDYVQAPENPLQIVAVPHQPRDIEEWKKTANRIEKNYSRKLGMIIGDVESLLHVEMLKGLIKTNEGATVKEYGLIPGTETDFATQVVVDEVYSADQRFLEKAALPIEEEFPVESRAFFLGDFAYGRPLSVISHSEDKTSLSIWVSVLTNKELEFGRDIAMQAERLSPYIPSFAVAKMLRLHPLALSKLTSSLSVNSGGLRLNLGLNLKFEAKKLKVLGYSRKANSGWEYSHKAIELIQQYMLKFPEFIAGISMNPSGNIYDDTHFYPEDTARDKMKEIGMWLKSIESKNFEKVPLEAEQLDSDIVMKIQEASLANLQKSQQDFKTLKGVPRNALLNPTDAEQRIRGQRFSLGDRVVYVLNSGRVPIAQRGTVIGLTRTARQTLLDVVFDTTFMSGTTLGDRCSPFHGSTVPSDSVLNLTDRQVVATSRAQAARKPPPTVQPLTTGGYGSTYGRQSVPAAAPPPLRGSFRAAATGQVPNGRNGAPNYGRGRGQDLPILNGRGRSGYATTSSRGNPNSVGASQGAPPTRGVTNGGARATGRGRGGRGGNQQGYTIVDQDDPTEGMRDTNFRPQQDYRNVPPPASLDPSAPQSGRGRGGANGRGNRGDRGGRGRPRARGRGAA